MANGMTDEYRLTAENQYEYEKDDAPIHLIATNTDDDSTTEIWMTLKDLRAKLSQMCPSPDGDTNVEGWMTELENYRQTEFGAPQPESVKGAATNRAIFKAEQLIPFGFSVSELRPWRVGGK
jgi:hypothetical protein